MNSFERRSTPWLCLAAVCSVATLVGCAGNNSGNGDLNAILRPWVIRVAPLTNTTGVPITNPVISATFSEQMAPVSGSTTFTLSSALEATVPGSVGLDSTKRVATFTPTNILVPLTIYTVTVNGFTSNTTGRAIEYAYVWTFTTGPALPTIQAPIKQ